MSQMRQYVDNKIFTPGEIIRAYYHDAVLEEYTPIHTHNFHELNIVIAGNGKHYINGSMMHITIGDLFIMPPNVSHGYEFESKSSTGNKGIQKDTLNAIASSDHYFDKNDIIEKGNKLNTYFLKKMTDEGITTFKKGDTEIANILGNQF